MKLLIADENKSIESQIYDKLKEKDLDVKTLGDDDLLEVISTFDPNIIILSLELNNIFKFLKRIMSNDSQINIIATSSDYSYASTYEAKELGIKDILLKPLVPNSIEDMVSKLVSMSNQEYFNTGTLDSTNEKLVINNEVDPGYETLVKKQSSSNLPIESKESKKNGVHDVSPGTNSDSLFFQHDDDGISIIKPPNKPRVLPITDILEQEKNRNHIEPILIIEEDSKAANKKVVEKHKGSMFIKGIKSLFEKH